MKKFEEEGRDELELIFAEKNIHGVGIVSMVSVL